MNAVDEILGRRASADEPALITDYAGTPSRYGAGLRDHLLGLDG